MGADSVNIRPLFLKVYMKAKVYFYGLGQSARQRGFTKDAGMEFYKIEAEEDYARIYFDKGYRGLSL